MDKKYIEQNVSSGVAGGIFLYAHLDFFLQ